VKTILVIAAAIVAAAIVFAAVSLPARRLTLEPLQDGAVPGVLHVHTNRSDGSSGPDEVAAAAARAGLKFVVFTDHGDATRTPDPPAYRSGVLCLDGVEISTSGGHYVAIAMPAAPYPLGGEPRDVVEDVRRLGGFGIAAHPDSPKPELRWEDWTAPIDAVELLNLDTSWRVLVDQPGWQPKARLLTGLLDYPVRPVESIARLIQPTAALPVWEAAARRRRVVTVAGADAHARLAPRRFDPGNATFVLPLPSYESSFKVVSVRIQTDTPLSGDASHDATTVFRAIRAGHVYTAIDGIAAPPAFEFTATNALGSVSQGDSIGAGGPLTLHVRSNAPASFVTNVYAGLKPIATVRDSQDVTVHASDAPGVYWVEIVSTDPRPAMWIRSNPVYVGVTQPAPPPTAATPTRSLSMFDGRTASGWSVEHDAQSLSAVDVATLSTGSELRFRFGLADGPAVGQYASLVLTLPAGAEAFDGIRFKIRAEKPMRLSVQARVLNADRWQRSIYVTPSSEEQTVRFDDVRPVGGHDRTPVKPADLRSVMFVVDTLNTRTGTSGRVWVKDVALVALPR
jgi:hypothetical protein